MADLFSFGSTPTPGYASLDSGTQGLLNQGVQNAQQPSSNIAAQTGANIQASQNALGSHGPSSPAETGMSEGMRKAMLGAYGLQAGQATGRLMQTNDMNAKVQKSQMLRQYANAALGQQQTLVNNYQNLTDAYNASEAARAQVISQVSGLASYGIGSYMGAKAPKGQAVPDMNFASDPGTGLGSQSGYYPMNPNSAY